MGLIVDQDAKAFLSTLAPAPKSAIRQALERLALDPHDDALDLKLLSVRPRGRRYYRMRVGSYRVVYRVDGPDVAVARIFHRRDGYGWLERV